MRSPLAVKRSHTSQKSTNTRKNRGTVAKNARRRQKEWIQSTIHHDENHGKKVTSSTTFYVSDSLMDKKVQFFKPITTNSTIVNQKMGDTRQLSRNKKNKKKVEEQQTKSDYKTTAFSVVKDNERDSQKAKHDPISKTSGHRIEDSVTSTNKKMGDSEIQKRCKDSHSSDKSSELETTFDKESTAAKNTHDASVTDKSVVVTDTEVSQTFPKRNQDPKFITNGCNETLKNEDADEKDRCSITKCEVDTLFEHGDSEELRVTKDNLDDIIDAEVAAFNLSSPKSDSPPIQVHEVTSTYTKEIERNTSEISETIAPQLSIDIKDVSPTRFAQNVQKLVEHTLKKTKHDIVEIDPSVKMTIDAQLLKLSEKKPIIVNEQKNHISPLPLELHYSRPSVCYSIKTLFSSKKS